MEQIVYATFGTLAVTAGFTHSFVNKAKNNNNDDGQQKENEKTGSNEQHKALKSLQWKFFGAYFLAILGDWLQGPYVYQLYSHYGFKEAEIALLFLTGFASSSSFGTFTGPLADKFGRRRLAMAFCVLYGTACALKAVNNLYVLLFGRIISGISTSLLFSVFESWYVKEHLDVQKLPSAWLADTFSTSTFANGLLAIMAGVIANLSAENLNFGPVAPFYLAIPAFVLCLSIVAFAWEENYGDTNIQIWQSYKQGLSMIWSDRRILFLGLIQSIIESCMYIFVFLWTPVLASGDSGVPLGFVFSCFMICIMLGSSLFTYLLNSKNKSPQDTLYYAALIFTVSIFVCSWVAGPDSTLLTRSLSFAAFLCLELSIGLYFPSIGTLRAGLIPESHRATVTNWFRVPMNVITCATLLAVSHPSVASDKRAIFATCTMILITGTLIAAKFRTILNVAAKRQ